ncbi:MAG: flagellar basal body rod protein FlgB [Deltaproteobacteria bacterium]|nr:flagellar basal body rod protein FlgB [Deltaproteobacteria bacterium]MBN2673714.1 flagellar basal body rod protein FlgB [Deltaproteobacteria bacterium]
MSIFTEVNSVAGALDFHMQRQNLISGNIANVDTPGYTPKEIIRSDFIGGSDFAMELRRTDESHFSTSNLGIDEHYEVLDVKDHVPGNDLNYVSLDQEMAKLNANTLRYETVSKTVTKQLGILKYAASDGR